MIGRDIIKLAILFVCRQINAFSTAFVVAGFGRVGTSVHWLLRVSLNEIELLCLQYIWNNYNEFNILTSVFVYSESLTKNAFVDHVLRCVEVTKCIHIQALMLIQHRYIACWLRLSYIQLTHTWVRKKLSNGKLNSFYLLLVRELVRYLLWNQLVLNWSFSEYFK